jgi:integrase
LRPRALAGLTAGDLDKRTAELTIGKDKTGKPRHIKLQTEAANLHAAQANNKLPWASLFMRANGQASDKETWKCHIAAAVAAAKLPGEATPYTLRNSTIS